MTKPHIFVADTNRPFLGYMQDLLEYEGYKVSLLQAEHTVYQEIKAASPDLLITNLVIGRSDVAWLLLQQLRRDPQTAHIPILACFIDHRIAQKYEDFLHLEGIRALEMPFETDKLLRAVEEALAPRKLAAYSQELDVPDIA